MTRGLAWHRLGPHDEHWVRGVHGQGGDTCDPRADPVGPRDPAQQGMWAH